MSAVAERSMLLAEPPDISHIKTEDDEPVDNIYSAKQQRFSIITLSRWNPGRSFVADANVGIFSAIHRPPIVPDVFLSLDVELPDDIFRKENRSYFIWEYGKPPDVVIEIVSNREGGELDRKLAEYARMRVTYYAVFDPLGFLSNTILQVFELNAGQYQLRPDNWMPQVDLGLTLWEGEFEGCYGTWLRWCDINDNILLTGDEWAEQESQRAEQESKRADQESERAERLAAQLRALGVEPDEE